MEHDAPLPFGAPKMHTSAEKRSLPRRTTSPRPRSEGEPFPDLSDARAQTARPRPAGGVTFSPQTTSASESMWARARARMSDWACGRGIQTLFCVGARRARSHPGVERG